MNPDILTPEKLFQIPRQYVIPTFQRPYVWKQERHWYPLWKDVQKVAESYLEEIERCENDPNRAMEQTSPHFLGAVVIRQMPTHTRGIDMREVIDGQQRVTTLQLLLGAIKQICDEMKQPRFEKLAYRLSTYTHNNENLIEDDKNLIFKLWPTHSDRKDFKHIMGNEPAVEKSEDSSIIGAHEFFQTAVREWLGTTEPIEPRVDALEAAVTSLLQLVVIDLEPLDDPNLIFETLNARGTPLEQSDLIKNYVISEAKDTRGSIWENMGDRWWRKEISQGRLFRTRLDVLLNYWLAMRTSKEVLPSDLFRKFREYVMENGVHEVMSEVKQDLSNYRMYESNGNRSPAEESFHYHMNVMQSHVITPVLLLLLRIDEKTRTRAFDILESFLVRRMICSRTNKDYNRMILELAGRLQEKKLENADVVILNFLKEQTAFSREWPRNIDVTKSMKESALYRVLTRGRLRLVLEGIESQLRSTGKSERKSVEKNLTIEHLMPVKWREPAWPLPKGGDREEDIHRRDTLKHSIGNLTLITGKLNSSISNGPWEHKRKELQKHSVLLLNNELVLKRSWNENSITARSEQLAEIISERWPGPK